MKTVFVREAYIHTAAAEAEAEAEAEAAAAAAHFSQNGVPFCAASFNTVADGP